MLNILYCGNSGVFDGVVTSALSALMRTKTSQPFTFYIFTMDMTRIKPSYTPVTEQMRLDFENLIKEFNSENKAVLCDVTALYEKELHNCPNEAAYCSPYTLIRLLCDLVPEIPKKGKLLYLDADVMFNREPMLIYDTDLNGAEYAAARDHYGKFLIKPNYINAGVLLFNMEKCLQTKIFEKSRELLRKKKLVFADQSALLRSTTIKKMLPQKYNDQKYLHKSTVIRHFSKRLFWLPYPHTANVKQWQKDMKKIFHYTAFDDILEKYNAFKTQIKGE